MFALPASAEISARYKTSCRWKKRRKIPLASLRLFIFSKNLFFQTCFHMYFINSFKSRSWIYYTHSKSCSISLTDVSLVMVCTQWDSLFTVYCVHMSCVLSTSERWYPRAGEKGCGEGADSSPHVTWLSADGANPDYTQSNAHKNIWPHIFIYHTHTHTHTNPCKCPNTCANTHLRTDTHTYTHTHSNYWTNALKHSH